MLMCRSSTTKTLQSAINLGVVSGITPATHTEEFLFSLLFFLAKTPPKAVLGEQPARDRNLIKLIKSVIICFVSGEVLENIAECVVIISGRVCPH